jgi:hypothetical protein
MRHGAGSNSLPASLVDAYLSATYEVDFAGGTRRFRHGESGEAAPPFAIVTACNPGMEYLPEGENETRNEWLEEMLDEGSFCYVSARGYDPGQTHDEPSFAVFGVEVDEALVLARDFEQAAIFWWDGRTGRVLFTG